MYSDRHVRVAGAPWCLKLDPSFSCLSLSSEDWEKVFRESVREHGEDVVVMRMEPCPVCLRAETRRRAGVSPW